MKCHAFHSSSKEEEKITFKTATKPWIQIAKPPHNKILEFILRLKKCGITVYFLKNLCSSLMHILCTCKHCLRKLKAQSSYN